MASDPTSEFQAAVFDAEELPRRMLRAFAAWFATEYGNLTIERWKREFEDAPPGGEEWFNGHRCGVTEIESAVEDFIEQHLP